MDVLLSRLLMISDADPVPQDKDVKAGWLALWIFVALCVAIALLGVSLSRHLRKIRENTAAGKFGEEARAKMESDAEEREAARQAHLEAQRENEREARARRSVPPGT